MLIYRRWLWSLILCITLIPAIHAKDSKTDSHPLASMPLRNIGPAMISGRISEFAFHPEKRNIFYVASASGNLWKTTNNGITWKPIFENYGSYALGTIKMDPNNPNVLWLGTGENNSQRSVAFGDGIYKTMDGGKSWKNMGLKDSGHISQIWVNPNDSNHVLVASQGPLWSNGGDRGLYKTTDNGQNWERILEIDKYTGINEFVIDPENPDNIVASSYQRRRHVWVLINGGPGSGIHKTTDGGKTWTEKKSGLPSSEMGRIGLASPVTDPKRIYAIIEGQNDQQGVYISRDFGESWSKQSSYMTTSPQYYNELIVDPKDPDRLYSLSTFTHISEDAGKNWRRLSDKYRHVDDHALWIDPNDTEHMFIGGDGGVYETWDRGSTWRHIQNLPLGQFYRATPDNAEPFYNICGGTQDNNSLCAPSRTTVIHGITNSDWNIILGGDGYKSQFDPNDPNIIYAQYQYGGLARFDKRTKEKIYITPHPKSGENQYKWNWNTPLIVSPHKSTRLYYAAEKVFQSDDRGDSWQVVSPDLTRQLDRNQLKVMDRVWSVDAVAKNKSTSMYGSIIGLFESPLQEGYLMVGTDDGVISTTKDGGVTWDSVRKLGKTPDMSYVSDVLLSAHDVNVAYATVDNHKRGDYKPYVLMSENQGKSWKSISSNLPERGFVHTIVEDHVDPNLLFVGTEFGLFFTQNGGDSWYEFKNLPTISVRDLEIQKRENDLVVATFGRGVYIVDDYTALRTSKSSLNTSTATLFPVKDTWLYIEGSLYDGREKGSSGSDFFTAKNPPYGVTFSYHLKKDYPSLKKQRQTAEAMKLKEGEDTPYPSWDELRKEDQELSPQLYFEVKDSQGKIVSRVKAKNSKGFHRTQWNFRYPAPDPVRLTQPSWIPYWASDPMGPLATPGNYSVTLMKRYDGKLTPLGQTQNFALKSMSNSPEISESPEVVLQFHKELAEMSRVVDGTSRKFSEMENRVKYLFKALELTPSLEQRHNEELHTIRKRMLDAKIRLQGDSTISSRSEPVPWSVSRRVGSLFGSIIESQTDVPQGFRDSLAIAKNEYSTLAKEIKMIDADLSAFEQELESFGAPWTPGRMPEIN